jgi:hypothetical protein
MSGPCSKCGEWRMSGPRYRKDATTGEECLVYTCGQCGYSMTTPTEDAKKYASLRGTNEQKEAG